MRHFDESEFVSDIFAHKINLITGIDARIKIAFILAALLLNLLSENLWTSAAIVVFCLTTLLLIKIPIRLLLTRLAMPAVMAIVILATQMFLVGNTPLLTIGTDSLHLAIYREGVAQGLIILSRVIAGVLLILFLSLSTPAHELLLAFAWFRMPGILVELGLLIYRYIFVLLDEAVIMSDAQKIRLGYSNWKRSMNSLYTLSTLLLLRAYDRSERVFDAMLVRGYDGGNGSSNNERLRKLDYLASAAFVAVLISLHFIGRIHI
jgi:cobalt/nickel transport system permease protein